MNNRNLIQEHKAVCNTLNAIYEQKNRAYGNSFGDTYKDLGIISAVTRISDKFNRLKTLCRQPDIPQGDESIADTLFDMANYCIMTYMELWNEKNKGIVIGEGIDADKLEAMRRFFSQGKPVVDVGGSINAVECKNNE